jgi:putative oxidoreductase
MDISMRWRLWSPQLLSVLRIVAGFLFMQPGMMKLFAYPIGVPPEGGTVDLFSELGVAGVLETVGGAMLILGLFTRPVAFILSGEMAVAFWQFHAPQGFWPIVNHGTDAMLYCFLFFYLSAAGGGPWGIDGLRKRQRSFTYLPSEYHVPSELEG